MRDVIYECCNECKYPVIKIFNFNSFVQFDGAIEFNSNGEKVICIRDAKLLSLSHFNLTFLAVIANLAY